MKGLLVHMKTKILKKMCIIGASTCLGLTCAIFPTIISTSCSSTVADEITPISLSNITTSNQTDLGINLSNINLDDVRADQENKCAYVLFEASSPNDKTTFTYNDYSGLTKTISLVYFVSDAAP